MSLDERQARSAARSGRLVWCAREVRGGMYHGQQVQAQVFARLREARAHAHGLVEEAPAPTSTPRGVEFTTVELWKGQLVRQQRSWLFRRSSRVPFQRVRQPVPSYLRVQPKRPSSSSNSPPKSGRGSLGNSVRQP